MVAKMSETRTDLVPATAIPVRMNTPLLLLSSGHFSGDALTLS